MTHGHIAMPRLLSQVDSSMPVLCHSSQQLRLFLLERALQGKAEDEAINNQPFQRVTNCASNPPNKPIDWRWKKMEVDLRNP